MLIVPVHRKLTLKYFPWVTALMILINGVVYFGLQSGDSGRLIDISQRYHASGLYQIELAAYADYSKSSFSDGEAAGLLPQLEANPMFAVQWFAQDQRFRQAVDNEMVDLQIPVVEWQQQRQAFDQDLQKLFINRYQLPFQDSHWWQWLTHQFLHGGFGHLLGNMIFLAFLGLLVEPALPALGYLASYLLGGVVAGTASWLLNSGEAFGLVGASGAIAGVMGMYAVLFGMRKVHFLYWVFVYFNYTKGPALLLLPAWLGWELLQLLLLDSRVAYEAHATGLLTGALVAWLWTKQGEVDLTFLDEDEVKQAYEETLRQAVADLKSLNLRQAKAGFRDLIEQHPDDIELREYLFRACCLEARQQPEDVHDAAKGLFESAIRQSVNSTRCAAWFADYRKAAQGKVRLSPSILVGVCRSLIQQRQRQLAEKLIVLLSRNESMQAETKALRAMLAQSAAE